MENEPRQPLEKTIEDTFRGVTTQRIIQKMQRAADFSTDDEEIELSRRLNRVGQNWRWTQDFSNPKIEIYDDPNATDEQLVNKALEDARRESRPISNEAARVISALYHGGQGAALYALTSSGAITEGLIDEIDAEIREAETREDLDAQEHMAALALYVASRDDKDRVPGWSSKWLGQEVEGDRCPACGAHVAEPHSPQCPLSPEDGEGE